MFQIDMPVYVNTCFMDVCEGCSMLELKATTETLEVDGETMGKKEISAHTLTCEKYELCRWIRNRMNNRKGKKNEKG